MSMLKLIRLIFDKISTDPAISKKLLNLGRRKVKGRTPPRRLSDQAQLLEGKLKGQQRIRKLTHKEAATRRAEINRLRAEDRQLGKELGGERHKASSTRRQRSDNTLSTVDGSKTLPNTFKRYDTR
jgi:hypothetical protein